MVSYTWFVEFMKFADCAGDWFFACGVAGEIEAEYFHKGIDEDIRVGP